MPDHASFPPIPPGCEIYSLADPLGIVDVGDAPPSLGGPYVIKNVLAPQQLGLLVGQPGCGKSMLGPRIAHAIARGEPILGRKTAQGPILWVAGEDHVGVIRRFHALSLELGDARGIFVTTAPLNLLHTGGPLPGAREVREAADATGATPVVVDTLSACFGGLDENDSCGMGAAVATLRSLASPRRSVLSIHHTPKAGTTSRGHGVLLGDADLAVLVEAEADGTRTLPMLKNCNGPSGETWRFSIRGAELGRDEEGDLVTAPIAEIDDTPPRGSSLAARLGPNARLALRLLFDLLAEEVRPLPTAWQMPNDLRAAPLERWRTRCRERGLTADADQFRKAFARAFTSLRDAGRIGCREHHGEPLAWVCHREEDA